MTLVDDNLVGDWNRVRAVPLSLYAEMSVDAVRDPELLELCRDANLTEMLLGVETPRKAVCGKTLKTHAETAHDANRAAAAHA